MKGKLAVVFAAIVGLAAGSFLVAKRLTARHAAELSEREAAWQAEKAALEAALEEVRRPPTIVTVPGQPPPPAAASPTSAKLTPAEIVAKLRTLRVSNANRTRVVRQMIYWTEELVAAGPDALPAIREFLARNEDADFDSYGRAAVPGEFVTPPSLRFALFDAVRLIGGADAEKLLAEVLAATGRGVEVAWLARTLQELAPGKYRDTALTAARDLLLRGSTLNPQSPLDRNERENLFSVLKMYGDNTYAATAQTQLFRADGQVDRSTLRYLQEALGPQSVSLATQMYDDPRLTDPASKEPFARLALNFVGTDPQANALYQRAINDMTLSADHRRNLIEDLNQDGFADRKNFSARDLALIQNRLAIIEQLAPGSTDPVNAAAFKEAYKDLVKMRERATRPPQPTP